RAPQRRRPSGDGSASDSAHSAGPTSTQRHSVDHVGRSYNTSSTLTDRQRQRLSRRTSSRPDAIRNTTGGTMTRPPQPPHEPHRQQPQGTPPPPWSPQPPPGLHQPPPVYNGAGNAAKSSTGPIIAAVIGVVLVALIALVSTIAITSSSNSSAAETHHTPRWEPDEHIT